MIWSSYYARRAGGPRRWLLRGGVQRCLAGLLLAWASSCAPPPPPLKIMPVGKMVTTERGDSAKIKVALFYRPRTPLEVYAVVSNPKEASVSGKLRFDRDNWNKPQVLLVTGLDDDVVDGDVAYDLLIYRQGTEAGDQPHLVDKVRMVNRDDDAAPREGEHIAG